MSFADLFPAFGRSGDTLPRIPDLRIVHWLPRILLAAIIIQQGYIKFPLLAADADGIGVPFFLWALVAFGEVFAGIALIAGGLIQGRLGDLLTRAGGAALTLIVAGVIYVVYWAPPIDLFLANQLHLLLLVGGLYFALRGNNA